MVDRKKTIIFILLFLFGISALFGNSGVHFDIRFFDRRVYYLDNDPILVQISITNIGPEPYRFRLAEDRLFSIDFDVRTNSNRAVETADTLIRRRTQSQQIFFRDITLETGESFSFIENLRDYAALNQNGAFIVQARLYPELFQERQVSGGNVVSTGNTVAAGNYVSARNQPLESNFLTLSIRPRPVSGPEGIPLELDVETNAVLVRERLPPDEVVAYLLTARQRSQWERFFLYLDLEAMISRDPLRSRQWNASSEEGRQRMLERYMQDLMNSEIDGDLYLIPSRFDMERTVYNMNTGTVTVMQYFDMGSFTQRKRYVWYLERRNDVWVVVDYSVTNLGTE